MKTLFMRFFILTLSLVINILDESQILVDGRTQVIKSVIKAAKSINKIGNCVTSPKHTNKFSGFFIDKPKLHP